jgi:hypothetical protein
MKMATYLGLQLMFTVSEALTPRILLLLLYYYYYYYYYYYFIIVVVFSYHRFPSPLVLLLNQWCTPPFRLPFSDCSIFLMCGVPSTTVFVDNLLNAFLILFPDTFF